MSIRAASVHSCADLLLAKVEFFDRTIAEASLRAGAKLKIVDGFEARFETNYLGDFVLVNRNTCEVYKYSTTMIFDKLHFFIMCVRSNERTNPAISYRLYRRSVRLAIELYGPESPQVGLALIAYADFLDEQGRKLSSARLYRKVRRILVTHAEDMKTECG